MHDYEAATVAVAAFVLTIANILLPLYVVGIVIGQGIIATSWLILAIAVLVIVVTTFRNTARIFGYLKNARKTIGITARSPLGLVFIAVFACFVVKYAYFLSLKGIFDWDATSLYLPFAQSIFRADRIPVNGFDFQPVIYPQGISVLYAWIYSIGGSMFDESYRLFPLFFVTVTVFIIYNLGKNLWSADVGLVSAIIYMLLPLHDSALFYASYYPDLCFNALVLSSFYFVSKRVTGGNRVHLLLSGASLGLALLLKLQAVFFLPAFLLLFAVQIRGVFPKTIAIFGSILFSGFLFVYFAWSSPSFFVNLPVIDKGLFVFSLLIAATVALLFIENDGLSRGRLQFSLHQAAADLLVLGSLTALVSGIWFIRNEYLVGSWVFYSNINDPALKWALSFLAPLQLNTPTLGIGQFLALMALIPFSVDVLGLLLVPLMLGVRKIIKERGKALILPIWAVGYYVGYFLFSFNGFATYALNERDMYELAPFVSILAAIGLMSASRFRGSHNESRIPYALGAMGFASLSQSLLVLYYGPTFLNHALNLVLGLFDTSIGFMTNRESTDMMLSATLPILGFSLVIGLLAISLITLKGPRIGIHDKGVTRKSVAVIMIVGVLVVPTIAMTYEYSGGNVASFGAQQLAGFYDGYYVDVQGYLANVAQNGDVILTFNGIALQYFLQKNVTVVDLSIASNLAAFKNTFGIRNDTIAYYSLRAHGVAYVILEKPPNAIEKGLIAGYQVFHDPRYVELVKSFPSWDIYKLLNGSTKFVTGWEDNSFLTGWAFLPKYSTLGASHTFMSNGTVLTAQVGGNASVAFQYLGIPPLNTTKYSTIFCKVMGTMNARWSFDMFSNDGTAGYAFPYLGTPADSWQVLTFTTNGTPLAGKTLSREATLELHSVDANPATIHIEFYAIGGYFINT